MARHRQRQGGVPRKASAIKNLLVLEDEPSIVELYRRIIEDYTPLDIGNVHFAVTGDDALRLASKHRMDVFSVDRDVPGVRGEDFIRIMRRMNPLAPVIVASGRLEERDLGEDYYLQKPFGVSEYSGTLVKADALLTQRRDWSPEKVVDFMEATRDDGGRVDEGIIKLSGWPKGKVEEYRSVFRGVFHESDAEPILSFSPAGFVAMVGRGGDVLINLFDSTYHGAWGGSKRLGNPYDRLLGAAEYVAYHEKMHWYKNMGFVNQPEMGVAGYQDLSPWAFELTGRGVELHEMFGEAAVDKAAILYSEGKILSKGYASFLESEADRLDVGHLSLGQLAKRQVVCHRQASLIGLEPDVSTSLHRVGKCFGKVAGDTVVAEGDRKEEVGRFYKRLESDLKQVYDGTTLDWQKIRVFESGKGRGIETP